MAAINMRHLNFWLPPDFRPNTQHATSQKHHRGSVAAANSRNQAVPLCKKVGSRLTHSGISRSAAVVTQEHEFSNQPVGDKVKTREIVTHGHDPASTAEVDFPSLEELGRREILRRSKGTPKRVDDPSPDTNGSCLTQQRLESSVGDNQGTRDSPVILEDNETSTVSLGATAVSTRVDDIESTVELNKQIGPLSNVENGCYVLEECSLPPLEVNHLIPILAEGNHHSPRLSQDATKQHSYGISEENWADTVPQPSNENGDHEHGEYVSEFEKDMLLAFKEQESLSLANIPNSLHPQNLSSEPAHPQIDQELDQSPTNVARLEEPRHGCSQVELPVQQRPEAAVDVMREADDGESLRGEQVKRRQDSLEEPQSEVHSTGSGCSRNTNDTGGEDKDDEDEEPRPAKRQKRVSVHPILTPQTPIFHSDNALEAPLGQLHSATIALATQLETEDTPPGADGRNLPTSPETEHYISRTSRSPTSSTALEITNLEESQGGIPAMDPNQEWEIRNIVGRKTAGGKVQYLVEWETTWMRESDLGQARELIDEFETDLKRGQQGVMSRSNALDEGEPKKRRGRPPNR